MSASFDLRRRLAITIGAPLACLAIAQVPAPGIPAELSSGGSAAALGILALGITPAVTAYALVEIASVVVPRFRPMRHGGPGPRQKLERASVVVMLLVALLQAYGIARAVDAGEVAASVGLYPMLLRIASWVAGACFALLVARWITRQGIANGFVLLSIVSIALLGSTTPSGPTELRTPRDVVLSIVAVVLLGLAVTVALRVLRPRPPPDISIPVPASSIVPFYGAVDALLILSAIAITNPTYAPSVRMLESSGLRPVVLAGICAVASVALGRQFHRPERVRELLVRIDAERAPSRAAIDTAIFRALVPTILFFVCMIFAETTVARAGRSLAWIPLALAALFDATDALRVHLRERDLECVWEERRPYAVAALVGMLEAERIVAWPLQLGQQVMLQIFGPYAPVGIWVRRADAERARKLVEAKLLGAAGAKASEEPSNAAVPELPERARVALLALGGLAALSIVLSAVPRASRREKSSRRAELAIVAVDDSVDPFEGVAEADLPRGVAIASESTPAGRDKSVRYARFVPDDGESETALRERIHPWLQKLPLPNDARIAFGRDRDRKTLRTFVLRGSPAITQLDVRRATPVVDRELGQVFVGVELENDGAERFRAFTRDNVRRRIAIVVDREVVSVPIVAGEVGGGRITITPGAENFEAQLEEAESLADALGGP